MITFQVQVYKNVPSQLIMILPLMTVYRFAFLPSVWMPRAVLFSVATDLSWYLTLYTLL